MKLPKHISLTIEHNPHRADYMAVETWMDYVTQSAMAGGFSVDETIRPEDRSEILRTQEIWVVSWYPQTPVGSREAISATLERALELAMEDEK